LPSIQGKFCKQLGDIKFMLVCDTAGKLLDPIDLINS